MSKIELTTDPFEIAQDLQMQLMNQPFDRRVTLAFSALDLLGRSGEQLRNEGASFLVDTRLAFDKTGYSSRSNPVVISFGGLALEGKFNDFDYLSLGDVQGMPINTLCATFVHVLLLPDGDALPAGDKLFVPVLGIASKIRTN
jgi:hypothetical protein